MKVWKMNFLSNWVMFWFHVDFPGCIICYIYLYLYICAVGPCEGWKLSYNEVQRCA